MPKRIGGTKRSSWLTFRRRLLLVRLLLRGPASKEELIGAVNREMGDQGYPGDAPSALKHDFDALKAEYGCRISFSRSRGQYTIDELGELALLDLPDEGLEALNMLDANFPAGSELPEHAPVRALLDRVLLLLPPYRQKQYRARRNEASRRLNTPRARTRGAPESVPATSYQLRYRLSPAVARRRDIGLLFPGAALTPQPDGGLSVSVTVANLDLAHQALLPYGGDCEVLAPPELVARFKTSARELARLYLGS